MITSQIVYLGELRTEAVHALSGNKLITDAPPDNQGKGEFFSPTDLLATSLGSCMLTIMGISARTHGFSIDVIVELLFPHNGYSAKERKLLELAAKECPVANSLHPDLKQTVMFSFSE